MIRSTCLDVPFRTGFTNGRHDGVADVPAEKGGAGDGFGPHELLEAALATCLTMTVWKAAAEHGVPLAGARSEVRIDRSAPSGVVLSYTLAFDGPLTDEQAGRLRAAAGRCPVARTLGGPIAVRPGLPVASDAEEPR